MFRAPALNSVEMLLMYRAPITDQLEEAVQPQRLGVYLLDAIPAAASGLAVVLVGGSVTVAVLVAGGVGFASHKVIEACRTQIAEIAENYAATTFEIKKVEDVREP